MARFRLSVALLLAACADQTVDRPKSAPAAPPTSNDDSSADAAPAVSDAAVGDAAPGVDASAPKCTSTFGTGITAVFGRLDGQVRAVVVPGDFSCPNDDNHAIVQVDAGGATYQIWVNVQSELSGSPPEIRFAQTDGGGAPYLPGGAWSAGWHESPGRFDYALDLGVHSTSFTTMSKSSAASLVKDRAKPGMRVTVYAEGFMTSDGAHKVHRSSAGHDGALVLDPTGSPVYLLFSFSTQSF